MSAAPVLEPRDADAFVAALRARLPGYVPGWQAPAGGPTSALLDIYGRMLQVVGERVSRMPDKLELAFLDLLGVELLPAQAARAPIVFRAVPGQGDVAAPAGTRLAAEVEDRDEPVVFETERDVMIAGAGLAEVATLWPARDAWADHGAAAASGGTFMLFDPLAPIPHALYVAHDRHLAFAGRARIEVDLVLSQSASAPLALAWEFWDGESWRAFSGDGGDGTAGLTRSGTVVLLSECGRNRPRAIMDAEAHWIRGRLAEPLPPDPQRRLPEIDRLLLRAVAAREIPPGAACTAGFLPDAALAAGQRADVTRTFEPLGPQPGAGAAFLFASEDAFGRPGARVTLCLDRPRTAAEQADLDGLAWAEKVNKSKSALDQALVQAELVVSLLTTLPIGTDPLPAWPQAAQDTWLAGIRADARTMLAGAQRSAAYVRPLADGGITAVAVGGILGGPLTAAGAMAAARTQTAMIAGGLAKVIALLMRVNAANAQLTDIKMRADAIVLVVNDMYAKEDAGDFIGAAIRAQDVLNAWGGFSTVLAGWSPTSLFDPGPPAFVTTARTNFDALTKRITDSRTEVTKALTAAKEVVRLLKTVDPIAITEALGEKRPVLEAPEVAWEYFDGARWAALPGFQGTVGVRDLKTSGQLSFDVPVDWPETDMGGQPGRWARARVVKGTFGRLDLITWVDGETRALKYMPIIAYRPPALAAFTLGYRDAPPQEPPERCVVHSDFAWSDHTAEAAWPGRAFRPFAPTADATPALYLGFDGPLPRGVLGVFLDLEEAGDPVALLWEGFDGDWRALRVDDGTRGLSEPGVVVITWPGAPADRGALGRFGSPRHWIRARLADDDVPPRARVGAIAPNAVWAAQVETVVDEVLGSANGQPRQLVTASRTPVLPGQRLEVRELEGHRAAIEHPLLLEDVRRAGGSDDDVRTVTDPATGEIRAVWVRWQERGNVLFSGPGDRHYTIERTQGRIVFGDGDHGRIPPPGRDNLRLARYRAGGGASGNVPAGAIGQVLSGLVVERAANPRAAEGGAEGEPQLGVLRRGPAVVRHRRQALSLSDYEALAREASAAVALARASGDRRPGTVTLRIAPWSPEPQPWPSAELRRRVREFVLARAPAALAGLTVTGPGYLQVGLEAEVAPADGADAAEVGRAVELAAGAFLHPLTGGPERSGWPLGRAVHLSDLAGLVEQLPGVDRALALALLVDGGVAGDHVAVPPGLLVAPGAIAVTVGDREG